MTTKLSTDFLDTEIYIYPKQERWKLLAACRHDGPTIYFPSPTQCGRIMTEAYKVCSTCPVRTACLEFALANNINYGVWGGVSEKGRKRIKKSRRENALLDAS